ncbi:MAG: hypothetical protein ACM3O8_07165 [Methylococcaceae bacterium]
MKTNWVYRTIKYIKGIYFKNDKRVGSFLVCVIIASGFWFLNALNKTYTVKMLVPVTYTNMPNNKILANKLPDKFELTIKAHGFHILKHKIAYLFYPLEFNVKEMTDNRMNISKRTNFIYPARQFITELSSQLSNENEMEILKMKPDTLTFKFDKLGQKWVKVKPLVTVDLEKQYQISGEITTSPDSILANGPQSVLDTLEVVTTNLKRFNAVAQPVKESVSLPKINEVILDTTNVTVNIPVEEYTEEQLSIPVMLKDQPSDVIVKLFPEKVKLTFQVGLSRFHDIDPEDFKLSVSYKDIQQGKQRLKVNVELFPSYLYDLKVTPEEIEYLIQH